MDSPVLRIENAATFVGLGVNEFRAAVERGEIAHIEDRGHRRYLVSDLLAYLGRRRVPAKWERETKRAPAEKPARIEMVPGGLSPLDGRPYRRLAR